MKKKDFTYDKNGVYDQDNTVIAEFQHKVNQFGRLSGVAVVNPKNHKTVRFIEPSMSPLTDGMPEAWERKAFDMVINNIQDFIWVEEEQKNFWNEFDSDSKENKLVSPRNKISNKETKSQLKSIARNTVKSKTINSKRPHSTQRYYDNTSANFFDIVDYLPKELKNSKEYKNFQFMKENTIRVDTLQKNDNGNNILTFIPIKNNMLSTSRVAAVLILMLGGFSFYHINNQQPKRGIASEIKSEWTNKDFVKEGRKFLQKKLEEFINNIK